MSEVVSDSVIGNVADVQYDHLVKRMQDRFALLCATGEPLFQTDTKSAFELYLGLLPADQRQFHNCSACKSFIGTYGSLVTINGAGVLHSAVWSEEDASVAPLYASAFKVLANAMARAKVTGPFLSSASIWGSPQTGPWRHFALQPQASMIFRDRKLTAGQRMAEKREDFKTVSRALGEFTLSTLTTALTLLTSDALYRSEKVLGQAQWLHDLHMVRDAAPRSLKDNVVWRAIATAPAGFCHPRSSMIGTLLEDIVMGMPFADVSARFKAKMHPLLYLRPQAAPAAGAIAAAEKIVEQLGIRDSLPRRFARLDEILTIWAPRPIPASPDAEGVFGHLKPKSSPPAAAPMDVPAATMTWSKFAATVLQTAARIEFYVTGEALPLTSLITAVNPDAPPILQWDTEEDRNPFSWYFWHGGSNGASFGLKHYTWVPVNAVALKPTMWGKVPMDHHGKGVLFVLDGAKDTRYPSACLFPEILKSSLHGVRSVIEAYSQSAQLTGKEEASAAGLMLQSKETGAPAWRARFRVTPANGPALEYVLDRWD